MLTLFTLLTITKMTGNTQKDKTSVTLAQEAATEICVKKNKVIYKVVTTFKAAVFIGNKSGTSETIPYSSSLVYDMIFFSFTQFIYKKT